METITSIDAQRVRVSSKTSWTFVLVRTSEGRCGLGEASLPRASEQSTAWFKACITPLIGQSADAGMMERFAAPDQSLASTAAKCAIDQALRDLEGQKQCVPIRDLFGETKRDFLAVYANINRRTFDRTPEGFAASAAKAADAGMGAVKIAPFDQLAPDAPDDQARPLLGSGFDRIAAVRRAIGPDRLLMVDCHERLSWAMFEQFLAATRNERLYWIESPFAEQPENYRQISRARSKANSEGVMLAGAELKTGLEEFRSVLDAEIYDVVMPDMTFAGGYRKFLAIAEEARARGVRVSPHNPWGPVCHAHSVHASAVAADFLHLETQFDESALFEKAVAPPQPKIANGSLSLLQGPGLGFNLVSEYLAPFLAPL